MAVWNREPVDRDGTKSRKQLRKARVRDLQRGKLRGGQSRQLQLEQFEPRNMFAVSPQLISIIPNVGDILVDGQTRTEAPRELTLRFDEGQQIDANSLAAGIRILRSGGDPNFGNINDVAITPGFIGIGDRPNEVVVRFADHLPDDLYQITVFGAGTPLVNFEQIPFNNGVDVSTRFDLDLGAQIIAVVPQPITRGPQGQLQQDRRAIEVFFNDDDLNINSASNPQFYQLIATKGTATPGDDVKYNPTSVVYNVATNRALLTFASDLSSLSAGEGYYRLRIGNADPLPVPPIVRHFDNPADDNDSTFSSAHNLGVLNAQSIVLTSAINPQVYPFISPGNGTEPGHRDIPLEQHLGGAPDSTPGISRIAYNFRQDYGFDPQGNLLANGITDEQKIRVREVFEFYSRYLGVQFYESPDQGFVVATGDLRVLGGASAPGGSVGLAGLAFNPSGIQETAILDAAENWSEDQFGGAYFETAMHEIGHLLGLGHSYDLPANTVQGDNNSVDPLRFPNSGEGVFPGPADIVHGQVLFRPESKDIDTYKFTLDRPGTFSVESVAERLVGIDPTTGRGFLDSVISVYNAAGDLIARNDDYYSEDSFVELQLLPGDYYVVVTSTGNTNIDPRTADSGYGGTTEGAYELRMNFRASNTPTPTVLTGLVDADGSPTLLDGDSDGKPGGEYNFWFTVARPEHTIYVDKSFAGGATGTGTLANPFNNIDSDIPAMNAAFKAAEARNSDANPNNDVSVIRIVGNNAGIAYELGVSSLNNQVLSDGEEMQVPQGTTVMIDGGAIFKLRRANIDVGSKLQGLDRSEGHLQVLGTPTRSVMFTSYENEAIGNDTFLPATTPADGDWGGIVFRNQLDFDENRLVLEDQGIFVNYINHAQLSYGGGSVLVGGSPISFSPIHLVEARPTLTYNTITETAGAAISADPDSFKDNKVGDHTVKRPDPQAGVPFVLADAERFTADYDRVGPDIYSNNLSNNTINGLFIRIDTLAGNVLDRLETTSRFDDTDIVHVLQENLLIQGTPGGPELYEDPNDNGNLKYRQRLDARLTVDPGIVVKSQRARIETGISSQLIAEGDPLNRVIFTSLVDDRFGGMTTFGTAAEDAAAVPLPGDWSGLYFGVLSHGSVDNALVTYAGGFSSIEGDFAGFNAVEIHQADVRLTNSIFEKNESGTPLGDPNRIPDRNGRGEHQEATIFVRGSQPIIFNNIIRDNQAFLPGSAVNPDPTRSAPPAISIDVNSLNSDLVADWGRSRGVLDATPDYQDNQGALIRENRLGRNGYNGLQVRAGVISTQSVWDDTDIVHIVRDEISIENHHTYGGLRIESSATESLVVKLQGTTAGFTAGGIPLDINDRIGGTLQLLGTPGHAVVLTSLFDSTVGAGLDPEGRPQTNTSNMVEDTGTTLPTGPEVDNGTLIDNDVPTATVGHFEMRVGNGADGVLGGFTAQGVTQLFTNANFVFDYLSYVDVGSNGGAVNLAATTITQPATLIAPDMVQSMGTFMGQNGLITWTALTKLDNGSQVMDTIVTFQSAAPLGNLRFINYLDEDVQGPGDDVMQIVGTPGQADFQVFTIDGPEKIGFSHSGVYVPGPGLQNATYDGWAADQFAQLRTAITGAGTTYSIAGNIDLVDLPPITDPTLGPVNGPNDVTTAFAWSMDPTATTATVTARLGFLATAPSPTNPGDWRSVRLDRFSNDRNVSVEQELEVSPNGTRANGTVGTAQAIGSIAKDIKSTDDNLRLGVEVHGQISVPTDVDIYSFTARAGTEVWIDIDRSAHALDVVVELIDAQGNVQVRSNSSFDETLNPNLLFKSAGVQAFPMNKDIFHGVDYYGTNPRDAGFRVVLPGTPSSTPQTYYLRVRSNSPNLNNLGVGGTTSGAYQLQVRIQELDEVPGSSVKYADIRFATNAIEVFGKPEHSPLLGESGESAANNDTRLNSQDLGNLNATDRAALNVSGSMSGPGDVDWYRFTIDTELIAAPGAFWPTVFDIDYADGIARPDLSISLYDYAGRLIYHGRASDITDDRVLQSVSSNSDLSRGSFTPKDPFLGTVILSHDINDPAPETVFYVAVSNDGIMPTALDQFTNANSATKGTRLQPISGIRRINEPGTLQFTPGEFKLGDVNLFVNNGFDLYMVDPFTGAFEVDVTGVLPGQVLAGTANPGISYNDIAMRSDGRLYSLTVGNNNGNLNQAAISGNLRQISTGDGSILSSVDDGIVTYQVAPPPAPMEVPPAPPTLVALNRSVHFEALAHIFNSERQMFAVGNIPGAPFRVDKTTNLLYLLDSDGTAINDPNDPDPNGARLPTDVRERGRLLTGVTVIPPNATDVFGSNVDQNFTNPGDIEDGTTFTITDLDGTTVVFEMDAGPDVTVNREGALAVRDGNTFVLSTDGVTNTTFEYNSGPVLVLSNGITNGQTFTIFDNAMPSVGVTFQFVNVLLNPVPTPPAGVIPIQFTPGEPLAGIVARTVTAINGAAFTVNATASIGSTNQFIGRISLTNDTAAVAGGANVVFEGTYGPAAPGNVLIPFEETDNFQTFGTNTVTTVMSVLGSVRAGFAGRTGSTIPPGTTGDRLTFYGALTSNFAGTPAFTNIGSTGIGGTSNIAVPFDAGDTSIDVGVAIEAAVNSASVIFPTFDVVARLSGNAVELAGADGTVSVGQAPIFVGGEGPGGTVTGLAFVDSTLYAVSDAGGLYIVNNPFAYETTPGTGPTLSYIGTATELEDIPFSGLSVGPQTVEGGRYSDMLFATDSNGLIHAFNTAGQLQEVFLDGASSIDTGISDLRGVAFSNIDFNLFHSTLPSANPLAPVSDDYEFNLESLNPYIDSLYRARGTGPGPDGDPGALNTYDVPGGANGTLYSNTFSLLGYTAGDKPAVYFEYDYIADTVALQDTVRVFVSNDGATWEPVITSDNRVFRNTDATRQAKIDLSAYAGLDNVRLRIDFSTAGDMDVNDPIVLGATGGEMLRSLPGYDLNDGDTFEIDGQVFEFDMGFSVVAPAGAADTAILDGDTFTVTAPGGAVQIFEFDSNGTISAGNIGIALGALDSSYTLAQKIADAVTASPLTGVTARLGETSLVMPLAAGRVITDGETFTLTDTTGASRTFEFDFDFPLPFITPGNVRVAVRPFESAEDFATRAAQAIRGSGLTGVVATVVADKVRVAGITGPILQDSLFGPIGVRIERDNRVNLEGAIDVVSSVPTFVVGDAPGTIGAGSQSIPIHTEMGSHEVARRMAQGVDQALTGGRIVTTVDGTDVVDGQTFTIGDDTTILRFEFEDLAIADGVAIGNIAVPFSAFSTADQIATAIADALNLAGLQLTATALLDTVTLIGATAFFNPETTLLTLNAAIDDPTNFTSAKVDGDLLQIIGHDVTDQGPLAWSNFLPRTRAANGALVAEPVTQDPLDPLGYQDNSRGQDNRHTGFRVRNFIVGFAERGEAVGGGTTGNTFAANPDAPPVPVRIESGLYNLEIRRGTNYGVGGTLGGGTFDTNDRLSQALSVFVRDGRYISDGELIVLSDGVNSATFEFDSNGLLSSPGSYPVLFNNFSTEGDVAAALRDAINVRAALTSPSPFKVRATSPGTGDRLDLINVATVNSSAAPSIEINLSLDDSFDVTETLRLAIAGAAGAGIIDGQTFVITANTGLFTFEFDTNGTVVAGNTRVAVTPAMTGRQVNDSIRDAINARAKQFVQNAANPADNRAFLPVRAQAIDNGDRIMLVNALSVSGFVTSVTVVDPSGTGLSLGLGDTNLDRDQGYTLIENNRISSAAEFGIRVDASARTGNGSQPHPGSPINHPTVNTQRLVPGIAIYNNIIYNVGTGGILFSGDNAGGAAAASAFGRIFNNTIHGGSTATGTGVLVNDGASPTLLNNVYSNLVTGVNVAAASQATTVNGYSAYKGNTTNLLGTTDPNPLNLTALDPLFVNADVGNFYPAANSKIIDSSIDTVQDRVQMTSVTGPLGIAESPILAPRLDQLGQLRSNDPNVQSPPGVGGNVFKDRGALDRVDTAGPSAGLFSPADNDAAGLDLNTALNTVLLGDQRVFDFSVQLIDGVLPSDPALGVGIDDSTVTGAQFVLTRDGVVLIENLDYTFSYDSLNDIARFLPTVGIWTPHSTYVITVDNSAATGVKDLAGNRLKANEANGQTRFTIEIRSIDFGDAPDTFPVRFTNDTGINGAYHRIVPGVRLGAGISAEINGQPSSTANADSNDDGVVFNSTFVAGQSANLTITASVAGFIDAWIDFNRDGDWNDAGERIFTQLAVSAGANAQTITLPNVATFGQTHARFRFSNTATPGGLSVGGAAANGEVEDYAITINPIVDYTLQLNYDATGQELYRDGQGRYFVAPNMEVFVEVYVQDNRGLNATAVRQAYADLVYDNDLFDFDPNPVFFQAGPTFSGLSGTINDAGQIVDEAGAVAAAQPSSSAKQLLFRVKARVKASAVADQTFTISTNTADVLPAHNTLVFGNNTAIAARYESETIVVKNNPWQNARNPLDVNANGRVNSVDLGIIINLLNIIGARELPNPFGSIVMPAGFPDFPEPFYDVNGDGRVNSRDSSAIVTAINAGQANNAFTVFGDEFVATAQSFSSSGDDLASITVTPIGRTLTTIDLPATLSTSFDITPLAISVAGSGSTAVTGSRTFGAANDLTTAKPTRSSTFNSALVADALSELFGVDDRSSERLVGGSDRFIDDDSDGAERLADLLIESGTIATYRAGDDDRGVARSSRADDVLFALFEESDAEFGAMGKKLFRKLAGVR